MNDLAQPAIVVGVDGSAESRAALRWAARHTAHAHKPICAVAVWEDQIQFGLVTVFPEAEFEVEARQWLQEALAELPDELPPDTVDTRIGRGDPARVLIEMTHDAELLVLGNHGRGALAGALLGSVAQRCAQHAECPVVLVPTDAAGARSPNR